MATDATNGVELWRTDGSESGTTLVKNINSAAEGSSPFLLTALNGYLYFAARDGVHGTELWRSNGTEPGTTLVGEINVGDSSSDSAPWNLVAFGDHVYFTATSDQITWGIWRTNGSEIDRVPYPTAGQHLNCECVAIQTAGTRLYAVVYSELIGHEFAYLDDSLPPTNRDGSVWTVTLVILAGLTAAASIGLRVRGAKRA